MGALSVEDLDVYVYIVAWGTFLNRAPEVIHLDLRRPSCYLFLRGKGVVHKFVEGTPLPGSLPSFFLHSLPKPATMHQLLNQMRTNPLGKPKDAHVLVYPTTNPVHTPPPPLRHGAPSVYPA